MEVGIYESYYSIIIVLSIRREFIQSRSCALELSLGSGGSLGRTTALGFVALFAEAGSFGGWPCPSL